MLSTVDRTVDRKVIVIVFMNLNHDWGDRSNKTKTKKWVKNIKA